METIELRESLNFGGTGSNVRSIKAIAVGLFRVVDLMFPIVRYIGQAFLSPEIFVRCVVSEAQITGTMVAPSGRVFLTFVSVKTLNRVPEFIQTCVSHHQSAVCSSPYCLSSPSYRCSGENTI